VQFPCRAIDNRQESEAGCCENEGVVALSLTLPLPPGVNNSYVTVGRRRVLSKEAKAFKADVRKLVEKLRASGNLPVQQDAAFRESLLGVYLTFHFETPFRRDLDGGLKIALDALGEAIGFDDRLVVDLQLTKRVDTLHPRLEVEIETISDWTFDPQYVLLDQPAEAPESAGEALE
jgi:crossover junction endodeoxyribonuclease RusA